MRRFATACVVAAFGLIVPVSLTALPLGGRLLVVGLLGVLGVFLALVGCFRRTRAGLPFITGFIFSVAGAGAWIGILSFSAELSKLPVMVIHGAVGSAVVLPTVAGLWFGRKAWDPKSGACVLLGACCALAVAALLVPPARRFLPVLPKGAVPDALLQEGEPHVLTEWVHERVSYAAAPFTDTATATLERGRARCGGIANVLHKTFIQAGVPARIVNLQTGKSLHTLVEYWDDEGQGWILADAQNDLVGADFGGVSARDVVWDPPEGLPRPWTGFRRLFVYVPRCGYVEIEESSTESMYGSDEPDE